MEGAPTGFLVDPTDGYVQGTPTAEGVYTLQITAIDSRNEKAVVEVIEMRIKKAATSNAVKVAVGLVTSFFLLLAFAFAGYKFRMKQIMMRAFDFETELEGMVATGEIEGASNGTRLPREIKRDHITMTSVVGSGAFGEVWKGVLDESKTLGGVPGYMVAVKTSLEGHGEGAEELTREALVMAQLTGHPNVVSLIGVVTSGTPLLLLLSLCEHGSLQSCLKEGKCPSQEGRNGSPPSDAEAFKMALEIARGMNHLVNGLFVHRDLAARNVLLDSEFVCKIADFGLSRGMAAKNPDDENAAEYYTSHHGTFPVRWTAPEAIENMKFSTTTDIWSYGIVMLEVVTGGDRPYGDLRNEQVISMVMAGHRAQRPSTGCSAELYAIMLQCWAEDAKQRPPFSQIATMVEFEQNKITAAGDGGRGGGGNAFSFDSTATHNTAVDMYLVPGTPLSPSDSADQAPTAPPRTKSSNSLLDAEDAYLQVGSTNTTAAAAAALAGMDEYLVPGTPLSLLSLPSSPLPSGEPEYDTSDLTVAELLGAEGGKVPLGEPEYETSDLATSDAATGDVVYSRSDVGANQNAAAAAAGVATITDEYNRIVPKSQRNDSNSAATITNSGNRAGSSAGAGAGGGSAGRGQRDRSDSVYNTANHRKKPAAARPVSTIYSTAVHVKTPPEKKAQTSMPTASAIVAPPLPPLPTIVLSATPAGAGGKMGAKANAPPPPTRLAPLPPPTQVALASAAFAPAPKLMPKQKPTAAVDAAFAAAATAAATSSAAAAASAAAPVAAPRRPGNVAAATAAPSSSSAAVVRRVPTKGSAKAGTPNQTSTTMLLNDDPMAPISI